MSLPLNTLIEHKDVGMARPLDPRSRAHACRLTGINEATARKLEREGVLPPADTWTAADLVWAKVLTTPGLRQAGLPAKPDSIGAEDVLIAPMVSHEAAEILPTMLQALGALDRLRQFPVACLQIGRWYTDLREQWV